MELDAFDRQLAVADAHHLAVVAPRSDLELVRDTRRGERVVAPDLQPLWEIAEHAAPVVLDAARLPVEQALSAADLAAERPDHRLVAEADAKGRNARVAQEADEVIGRTAGAGGEDEVRRLDVPVQLLRPPHGDVRAELLEV